MRSIILSVVLALSLAVTARAQSRVSREAAVDSALRRGTRLVLARADSASAEALRVGARALPNPQFLSEWTKSYPTNHLSLALPIDVPWLRGPRIAAADAAATAARTRFAGERNAVRFEVEKLYAQAQVADALADLSERTAKDADSLVVLARIRRDAGDASDLEVELAAITAGQLANRSAEDSLTRIAAFLDVQRVMGLPGDSVTIALGDSLALPLDSVPRYVVATLPVLAARASLEAAEHAISREHAEVFGVPTVSVGMEKGDPGQAGVLPMASLGFNVPLFDRRKGPIALAAADRDRAAATLAQTRRDSDADIARANRELAAARARVRRGEQLLASADRISRLALVAYREGASTLPAVIEAVRSAREAQAGHISDLGAAIIAASTLRWLTATLESP